MLDFRNLNTTAFSQEEIENARYYNTHSFISNIYMHYGLVGAVFYIIYLMSLTIFIIVGFVTVFVIVCRFRSTNSCDYIIYISGGIGKVKE